MNIDTIRRNLGYGLQHLTQCRMSDKIPKLTHPSLSRRGPTKLSFFYYDDTKILVKIKMKLEIAFKVVYFSIRSISNNIVLQNILSSLGLYYMQITQKQVQYDTNLTNL